MKKMAKLTSARRNKLPKSKFALPAKKGPRGGSRSRYPVDTPARARNAKARAAQQFNRGNLSASQEHKVFAKADKVLRRGHARGK